MLVPRYAFDLRDPAQEWLFFKRIATCSGFSFQDDKFSFSTLTSQGNYMRLSPTRYKPC